MQTISLRAPDNIKIDGNAKEWNNSFQAWTTVDRMFYTISNDDNKLYLTVGIAGPYAINKIVKGGVTLTISRLTDKKKREKDTASLSVTFPVLSGNKSAVLAADNDLYFTDLMNNPVANQKKIDSVSNEPGNYGRI